MDRDRDHVRSRCVGRGDRGDTLVFRHRLPFGVEDRRFVEQWGWIPGMGHSVVILGRTTDGNFIVGDPAVGLEIWSKADLDLLWSGVGMRVE